MTQIKPLKIGDRIGFVTTGSNIDEADRITFFTVVEITTRDGERAYRYQFPDGEVSRGAIIESSLDSPMIRIERTPEPDMICLTDRRRDEITTALKRSFKNQFEVYGDWYRDAFVVVNLTNKSEYRVELMTVSEKVFARCECKDFKFRKHACKHLAEVLQFQLFGMRAAA